MNEFTRTAGIEVPLICGAMYPCSNPELVAAVSKVGGIGIAAIPNHHEPLIVRCHVVLGVRVRAEVPAVEKSEARDREH